MLLCVVLLVPVVIMLMLLDALVLLPVALVLPLALWCFDRVARGRCQDADADGLGVRRGLGLLRAGLPQCDPRAREPVHAGERGG